MTCEEIRCELLGYINNSIKRKEATIIERHLEICRECREIADSFSKVWDELLNLSLPPSQEMKERVSQNVMKFVSSPMPVSQFRFMWVYAVAAVLLMVVGLSIYCYDQKIPRKAAKVHLESSVPPEISDITKVRSMATCLLKIEPEISLPRDTTLLGSRVCKLNDMVVPHVMYQYQGIPISLFIWDTRWSNAYDGIPKNMEQPVAFRKHGQSVVIWERKSLMYCLVADLQPGELTAIFGLPTNAKYYP